MTLRRWLPGVVLSVLVAASAEPPALQQAADRLAGSVYTGPSMDTLRDLTDGFGGRVTGSPAYEKAAEWAAARFKSYGIQNVKLEPFTIPAGWQRGTAVGRMLRPAERPLHLESIAWVPSTPAGGVRGEVVLVDDITADKLRARTDLRGRIVLLDTAKIYADGFLKALPLFHAAYPLLKEAGVLGVLYPDRESNNVFNAHEAGWGAVMSVLPIAQLGMEDSKLFKRMLEHGEKIEIAFDLQNQVTGSEQVHNVIAEIRGSEKPEEWILIGAHLDSWDFGSGAQDNGTGTATVLEAARAIASLGQAPRRSIRFALWGGEEQGLLGSYAYTQAHTAELEHCVAVLNTDNGSGHPKGWKVEGRPDLRDAMQPLSDSLLKGLNGGGLSLDVSYDTDHGPFMLYGIPALDLWVDMAHYGEVHHKSSDTFDKVDALDFKGGAAIVTVTAYAIAQDAKPIAAHIDHAAVGAILKKQGLEDLLISVGQWKP